MKKHILCLGDSNTHGFCADPSDCAGGGWRFDEEERWPCLLQKALGDGVLVTEEGLSGRTTVFPDPLDEGMDAKSCLSVLLRSHQPLNLLIIMLGTNDTKERLGASAACIAAGMERLIRQAQGMNCWTGGIPRILIVCPPPIGAGILATAHRETMGADCVAKSEALAGYYEKTAALTGAWFLDARGCECNQVDFMHLTRRGHAQLAERIQETALRILAEDGQSSR